MAATINDIAKRVGVTKQTVSKIFNNTKTAVRISDTTKQRVLDAARELNYKPNYFAKSLKDKKTNCIGLIGSLQMANFWQVYFTHTIHAIEKEMANNHSPYSLVVFGAHYNETYDKSMALIQKGMVDGLILVILSNDMERFREEMLPELKKGNMPFVVIHSLAGEYDFNNVGVDTLLAGKLVGEHIGNLGYTDVGILRRTNISPVDAELYKGYCQGLNTVLKSEPKIRELVEDEIDRDLGYKGGYQAGLKITNPPRAIFCPRDQAALGLIDGMQDQGIRVPEDVAVIAYTDYLHDSEYRYGLSAVRHPIQTKGFLAVRMLTGLLEEKLNKDEVHQEMLEPKLHIRKTCGGKKPVDS